MKETLKVEYLKSAVLYLHPNLQKRISTIENLGYEANLVHNKESKLPAKTRYALEELVEKYLMLKENKVLL